MAELEHSAALGLDGTALPGAPPLPTPATWLSETDAPTLATEGSNGDAAVTAASEPPAAPPAPDEGLDPAVAGLCVPLSSTNPCGPDLDLDGDADFLNFLAQAEGVLPSSFFSVEDGKPFDRSAVDLKSQIDAIGPLWERTRDLRLLVMRARLKILDRDLAGFAVAVAAIAQWLDRFWDDIHPRASGDDLSVRAATLGALDLPTVTFPLQYAPLCEGRRIGNVSYRTWMVASGEVKPRPGEQQHPSAAVTEAIADADPDTLAAARRNVAMLKAALLRIRNAFALHGASAGLESLPALADKMLAFVDPRAAEDALLTEAPLDNTTAAAGASEQTAARASTAPPSTLAEAQQALAAIADYYSRSEPSSPALPLVRQAHQLIGKSFFEVMSILVPSQMDKAAFQIGADQFFELPVGKLSKLSEVSPPLARPPSSDGNGEASGPAGPMGDGSDRYTIASRAQAIALLDQVQRYFRLSEPSSPVPMLCDRARALAERDFMGVLRDVLPKAALKTFGAEK